jgi:hypothetical protein
VPGASRRWSSPALHGAWSDTHPLSPHRLPQTPRRQLRPMRDGSVPQRRSTDVFRWIRGKTEAWGIPCRRPEMQAVGICRVPQPRKSGPRSTQLSPVLPVSRCAAWHAPQIAQCCRCSCRIVPHRRILARPDCPPAGRPRRSATACDALGRVCWLECWLFCRQEQGLSVSSSREFVNPDWSHCG